jgi:hypothetical protein
VDHIKGASALFLWPETSTDRTDVTANPLNERGWTQLLSAAFAGLRVLRTTLT